jgi:hypothetical protein
MAGERHGIVCVNQTQPHCVNEMGNTQSKALTERYGRGTAWERHGICESALKVQGHCIQSGSENHSIKFRNFSVSWLSVIL